jgi:hypothetical protein
MSSLGKFRRGLALTRAPRVGRAGTAFAIVMGCESVLSALNLSWRIGMLRKLLELLGLVASKKPKVVTIGPSACETLDSLALVQVLGLSRSSRSRKG